MVKFNKAVEEFINTLFDKDIDDNLLYITEIANILDSFHKKYTLFDVLILSVIILASNTDLVRDKVKLIGFMNYIQSSPDMYTYGDKDIEQSIDLLNKLDEILNKYKYLPYAFFVIRDIITNYNTPSFEINFNSVFNTFIPEKYMQILILNPYNNKNIQYNEKETTFRKDIYNIITFFNNMSKYIKKLYNIDSTLIVTMQLENEYLILHLQLKNEYKTFTSNFTIEYSQHNDHVIYSLVEMFENYETEFPGLNIKFVSDTVGTSIGYNNGKHTIIETSMILSNFSHKFLHSGLYGFYKLVNFIFNTQIKNRFGIDTRKYELDLQILPILSNCKYREPYKMFGLKDIYVIRQTYVEPSFTKKYTTAFIEKNKDKLLEIDEYYSKIIKFEPEIISDVVEKYLMYVRPIAVLNINSFVESVLVTQETSINYTDFKYIELNNISDIYLSDTIYNINDILKKNVYRRLELSIVNKNIMKELGYTGLYKVIDVALMSPLYFSIKNIDLCNKYDDKLILYYLNNKNIFLGAFTNNNTSLSYNVALIKLQDS